MSRRVFEDYVEAHKTGKSLGTYSIKTVLADNYNEYYIYIKPSRGIYKNQVHIMHMKLNYSDHKYPFQSPLVKFVTEIFHVNISTSGTICLDIFNDQTKWVPKYNFSAIIKSILLLFDEQCTESPFNCDASELYKKCLHNYNNEISELTKYKKIITTEEEEFLLNKNFQRFIEENNKIYKRNNLESYKSYFPELNNSRKQYEEEIEHIKDIECIIDGLKNHVNKKQTEFIQQKDDDAELLLAASKNSTKIIGAVPQYVDEKGMCEKQIRDRQIPLLPNYSHKKNKWNRFNAIKFNI